LGQGDSGDFKAGHGRSSICLVSGSSDCLFTESKCDALLHEQDSGARKKEGDSDQDAGKAGGETLSDCLDLDEEKGEFQSGLFKRRIKTTFMIEERSPSINVEAPWRPRVGQYRASR